MSATKLNRVGGWCPLMYSLVADPRYGLTGAAVFGVVWRHCQRYRGVCDASQDTLAELIGVSRKTVNHYLTLLVQDGYLQDITPETRKRLPRVYRDTGLANVEEFILPNTAQNAASDVTVGYNYKAEATPVVTAGYNYETVVTGDVTPVVTLDATPDVTYGYTKTVRQLRQEDREGEDNGNTPPPASKSLHPALEAWNTIVGKVPHAATHDLIKLVLGEIPDIDRLRTVYSSWVASGYNPDGVKGVLDWYRDGVTENNGRSGRRQPQPAKDERSASERQAEDAQRIRAQIAELDRREAEQKAAMDLTSAVVTGDGGPINPPADEGKPVLPLPLTYEQPQVIHDTHELEVEDTHGVEIDDFKNEFRGRVDTSRVGEPLDETWKLLVTDYRRCVGQGRVDEFWSSVEKNTSQGRVRMNFVIANIIRNDLFPKELQGKSINTPTVSHQEYGQSGSIGMTLAR